MKQTGITNKPKPPPALATAITSQGPPTTPTLATQPEERGRPARKPVHPLWRALELAASLRITVVLFAFSLVLVFYGTWAQVDQGVWSAVAKYFRSGFV